jgi:hypothetical protein
VLLCGDRRSKAAKDNQGDNVTLIEERGNSSNYTLARLKRDRPDLAERVITGEMARQMNEPSVERSHWFWFVVALAAMMVISYLVTDLPR